MPVAKVDTEPDRETAYMLLVPTSPTNRCAARVERDACGMDKARREAGYVSPDAQARDRAVISGVAVIGDVEILSGGVAIGREKARHRGTSEPSHAPKYAGASELVGSVREKPSNPSRSNWVNCEYCLSL